MPPPLMRKAGRLQLIQNSAPSVAGRRQCCIRIGSDKFDKIYRVCSKSILSIYSRGVHLVQNKRVPAYHFWIIIWLALDSTSSVLLQCYETSALACSATYNTNQYV